MAFVHVVAMVEPEVVVENVDDNSDYDSDCDDDDKYLSLFVTNILMVDMTKNQNKARAYCRFENFFNIC